MNAAGNRTTVLVCLTCRAPSAPSDAPRAGLALAHATAAALARGTVHGLTPGDAAADILVEGVRCLANCNRSCSAAIRRDNAWTYVFGDLDAQRDGLTLIEGARLYASAADGLMPWRGRPEPLKRGLIARVPPLDFTGEPVNCAEAT